MKNFTRADGGIRTANAALLAESVSALARADASWPRIIQMG
jgi:hypothetical protein